MSDAIDLKAEGLPFVLTSADMRRLLNVSETVLSERIERGEVPTYRRAGKGPKARYEWLRPVVQKWIEQQFGLRDTASRLRRAS